MRQTPPNSDAFWIAQALQLALHMRGQVWPNPPVGCVIVRNGEEIARGETQAGGRPHAERVALERAGAEAKGATLYVTLEPCCHWGETPPCTDAIISFGIRRVVAAMQDPDPRVNGGGFRKLQDAGIVVDIGEGADEAQAIMSGFLHRTLTGLPEVIALERPADAPPPGIDALLVSTQGRLGLRLPVPRIPPLSVPDTTTDILAHLGDIGLTSVAIWQGDPAFPALAVARG